MSAGKPPFEWRDRFIVVDDSLDSDRAHVHDTTLPDPCIASFAPAYRDRAVRLAEELNAHDLAEQLRNAPGAPGFRRLELPRTGYAAGGVLPPQAPAPLRANPAAFPNTASGVLQPPARPPRLSADCDRAYFADGRVEAIDVATQAKINAMVERQHQPRPELFDEPEPGGSVPAYQPRGDEGWQHCSPELLKSFNERLACKWLPRRPCACPELDDAGHDHSVALPRRVELLPGGDA